MGLQHCIEGEGGFLNTFFETPIILCHWLSEIYEKRKKNDVLGMLFEISHICFSESDYVTLRSFMNITRENGAKMTHKLPK